jgi:hypothetical protein
MKKTKKSKGRKVTLTFSPEQYKVLQRVARNHWGLTVRQYLLDEINDLMDHPLFSDADEPHWYEDYECEECKDCDGQE